jgi:hypothetical protein
VYHGPLNNKQYAAFMTAVSNVGLNLGLAAIEVETLSLLTLREDKNWSLERFVTWLMRSDVHFIICHAHQGTRGLDWSIEPLRAELQRLKNHPGFPSGKQLDCPIFTQDKWEYIEALNNAMHGFTMPTFKIPVSRGMNMTEMEAGIRK